MRTSAPIRMAAIVASRMAFDQLRPVHTGSATSAVRIPASLAEAVLDDESAEHARVDAVPARREMKVAREEQRRRRRILTEGTRGVHERDAMLRCERLQLLERPIVQVHGIPADAILIANRWQRRGVSRRLPRLRISRQHERDAVVLEQPRQLRDRRHRAPGFRGPFLSTVERPQIAVLIADEWNALQRRLDAA